MENISIIGINLAKRSFQFHGARRFDGLPQDAISSTAHGFSGRISRVHRRDGGMRYVPFLRA